MLLLVVCSGIRFLLRRNQLYYVHTHTCVADTACNVAVCKHVLYYLYCYQQGRLTVEEAMSEAKIRTCPKVLLYITIHYIHCTAVHIM
jgi:hypothetical protein